MIGSMASTSTYWRVGQLLSIAIMFTAFFAVVPYLGSDPIEEVSPSVAAQMPAGCPAVFTNHKVRFAITLSGSQ